MNFFTALSLCGNHRFEKHETRFTTNSRSLEPLGSISASQFHPAWTTTVPSPSEGGRILSGDQFIEGGLVEDRHAELTGFFELAAG